MSGIFTVEAEEWLADVQYAADSGYTWEFAVAKSFLT